MGIKTEITEKRYVRDKFLGITCTGNSQESYLETQTTTCDVCGAKRVFVTEVEELLHVPSTIRRVRDRTGPMINKYEWGYKKSRFFACDEHTERELDKHVARLKAGRLKK